MHSVSVDCFGVLSWPYDHGQPKPIVILVYRVIWLIFQPMEAHLVPSGLKGLASPLSLEGRVSA